MHEYELLIETINPCGGEAHAKKEFKEVFAESPESYVAQNGRYPVIDSGKKMCIRDRYGLGLTPLYVQLGEKTYRDGEDIFPDDIYEHVANGGELAATAAVNLADYVRLFSDLSRKYDFVIHICISSD